MGPIFNRNSTLATVLIITSLLGGCATTGSDQGPDIVAYDELVTQAEESVAEGNLPEAIMNYMGAQDILPNAGNWHRIGLLQLEQGNEFPAMSAFQNAISVDDSHAPSLQAAGLLHLHWKQSKYAESVLTRAVQEDDGMWRSHNALGIVADLDGDPDLAQEHYAKALALKPDSSDILNNIGYSHFLSGKNEQAQHAFGSAIKNNREHRLAWENLARVLARQKRYDDAYNILISQHEKAIAYHDVGYIALINGDYVFADDYLSKAIQASPTYFKEAFQNRETARNRMIGNNEGNFVSRSETRYPFCIGLRSDSC